MDFLIRLPFALLGALALLSIVSQLVPFQADFGPWLASWQQVTRAAWDFVLGPIAQHTGFDIPSYAKDYLTAGVIFSAAYYWMGSREGKMEEARRGYERRRNIIVLYGRELDFGANTLKYASVIAGLLLAIALLWPVFYVLLPAVDAHARTAKFAFFEALILCLGVAAVNYALAAAALAPS
jgi:hypothetical protein